MNDQRRRRGLGKMEGRRQKPEEKLWEGEEVETNATNKKEKDRSCVLGQIDVSYNKQPACSLVAKIKCT